MVLTPESIALTEKMLRLNLDTTMAEIQTGTRGSAWSLMCPQTAPVTVENAFLFAGGHDGVRLLLIPPAVPHSWIQLVAYQVVRRSAVHSHR